MILPIVNIISGFLLGAPKIKEWFLKQQIEGMEKALMKFRIPIGVIVLLLGIVGILKRMSLAGLMYEWSWHYGSSFPQAIIAIVIGLHLCADFFSRWPILHSRIIKFNKYREWIGILGILIGAGSII